MPLEAKARTDLRRLLRRREYEESAGHVQFLRGPLWFFGASSRAASIRLTASTSLFEGPVSARNAGFSRKFVGMRPSKGLRRSAQSPDGDARVAPTHRL